jgi:hypothetical protein
MAALSRQLRIYAFGAAALMRLNVRLWHGAADSECPLFGRFWG